MTKREKDWIHIATPENKNMIAAPDYIRKLLGIDNLDVDNVYRRLMDLETRLNDVERPLKKQKILELLANGEVHNEMWIENRVENANYWIIRRLLSELVSEGKLVTEKRGTQTLYSLAKGVEK